MLEMIYIIMIFAWILLFIGFNFKEYTLLMFSSIVILIIGVYVMINGFPSVTDWFTRGIAAVHIGIGGYVLLRSGYEEYRNL